MQRSDRILLEKILDAIEDAIEIFGDASKENFLTSKALKLSMAMSVIRVGELVKNLTLEFCRANPHVLWRSIAGYRDVAAQKYDALDFNRLYITIKEEFPELQLQVEKILMERNDNGKEG